jgi:hypothetical protein
MNYLARVKKAAEDYGKVPSSLISKLGIYKVDLPNRPITK